MWYFLLVVFWELIALVDVATSQWLLVKLLAIATFLCWIVVMCCQLANYRIIIQSANAGKPMTDTDRR